MVSMVQKLLIGVVALVVVLLMNMDVPFCDTFNLGLASAGQVAHGWRNLSRRGAQHVRRAALRIVPVSLWPSHHGVGR